MAAEPTFRFRVEGLSRRQTWMPKWDPFEETYDLPGEHPAEVLETLLHEIEWGILDAERGFTITFVPAEDPA